jgi:hypothetical protein
MFVLKSKVDRFVYCYDRYLIKIKLLSNCIRICNFFCMLHVFTCPIWKV